MSNSSTALRLEQSDRPVAAQALLSMAETYQKMGDSARERTTYERLVKEFADQAKPVGLARTRLGVPDRSQADITLRKVFSGSFQAAVSPDGRYLAHDNWPLANKLIVREIATGAEIAHDATAFAAAFSPDSSRVVYSRCSGPASTSTCEVRMVDVRGARRETPRTVFSIKGAYVGPTDWSPDGQTLAVYVHRQADLILQLGLIAISDGTLRVLKSTNWGGGVINGRFSPDGRDIAFNANVSDDNGRRDIYLMAADASREVALVTNPGDDFVLGWTPDGTHLLFSSDRNGNSLWAQAVADRKPQGPPRLITPNIGPVSSARMTKTGALYLGRRTRADTIEVASIDLATGKGVGLPTRPIRTAADYHRTPEWSRDGRSLAYGSQRDGEFILGIRSLDTGSERELKLGASLNLVNSRISWAPDGSFVTYGRDLKGRYGVFRIDARDGSVTPIQFRGPQGRAGNEGFFWSPDGAKMYYRVATGGLGSICERDVVSGTERNVVDGQFMSMTLSPDGRWFAVNRPEDLAAVARGEGGTSTLVLIPVAGGQQRELLRGVRLPVNPEWAPDGQALLVSKTIGKDVSELWLVPIDGGTPRKFDFVVNGGFRLSPDGRQVAYSVGEGRAEVWAVENFLPAMKAR